MQSVRSEELTSHDWSSGPLVADLASLEVRPPWRWSSGVTFLKIMGGRKGQLAKDGLKYLPAPLESFLDRRLTWAKLNDDAKALVATFEIQNSGPEISQVASM